MFVNMAPGLTRNEIIQAQFTKERDTNLLLQAEKEMLEQDRARLKTLNEQINGTLDAILQKSGFPAQQYCQSSGDGKLFY